MKLADSLTLAQEVLHKLTKNRVRIGTRVLNQNGEAVVEGEAEVLAPKQKLDIELPALPPITIG